MSKIEKNRLNPGWLVLLVLFGLADLGLVLRKFMQGHNMALFNARGLIAEQQHSLIMRTVGILLILGIPALFLIYFTAWKYRESNTKATHNPNLVGGKWFNISAWAVPTIMMLILATMMWPATHKLDPRKSIASVNAPLTIRVISMRWKWLFLYPDQGIASVNFVEIPINTPVKFELTADEAPMSSFWIPNLGGQLYSMTGMVNRLNLMADTPGDYPGSSAEINGAGFAGMKFTTRATDTFSFNQWVQNVKQSPNALDSTTYSRILQPSEDNPVKLYSSFDNSIYDTVIAKYLGPGGHHH